MKNYKDHELEVVIFSEKDAIVADNVSGLSGSEFDVGELDTTK